MKQRPELTAWLIEAADWNEHRQRPYAIFLGDRGALKKKLADLNRNSRVTYSASSHLPVIHG